MRAHQVFAAMEPAHAETVLRAIAEHSPAVGAQAVAVAAAAMNARPVYLRKQPFPKRAAAVRRALARVSASEMAEEILAVYFLECRKALLLEWLGHIGLEHEDGALKEDAPPQPDEASLRDAVATFRGADDDPDRELLLRAFAAQTTVDWPALDALLER
jgi:hypothetical protein